MHLEEYGKVPLFGDHEVEGHDLDDVQDGSLVEVVDELLSLLKVTEVVASRKQT